MSDQPIVIQRVNLSSVNQQKEITRYVFKELPDWKNVWDVFRRGKRIGLYSADGFNCLPEFKNLSRWVARAWVHQERQRIEYLEASRALYREYQAAASTIIKEALNGDAS